VIARRSTRARLLRPVLYSLALVYCSTLIHNRRRWPAAAAADCAGQGVATPGRGIGRRRDPTFADPQPRPPLPAFRNGGADAWGRWTLLAARVATRSGAGARAGGRMSQ